MKTSKTTNVKPRKGDRLLDDREVAAVLGVSACTARRLRYRGDLPTVKVGAAARTLASALENYIASRTVTR